MTVFNISQKVYNAAMDQVNAFDKANAEISASASSDWLLAGYTPSDYLNISSRPTEIYSTNEGTEGGTTFKIDTGGYVFSCLFDTGAEETQEVTQESSRIVLYKSKWQMDRTWV